MTATITNARPDDAAEMGRILSDWIEQTPWMPRLHSRAGDVAFCAGLIDRCEVLVLRAPSVAGFLARQDAEIDALYLAADARRQGHGRALIGTVKRQCKELRLWTFQANLSAIRFYEAQGFVEIERTEGSGNDESLPDIRLQWKAAPI